MASVSTATAAIEHRDVILDLLRDTAVREVDHYADMVAGATLGEGFHGHVDSLRYALDALAAAEVDEPDFHSEAITYLARETISWWAGDTDTARWPSSVEEVDAMAARLVALRFLINLRDR
jgi:hypothetical protein